MEIQRSYVCGIPVFIVSVAVCVYIYQSVFQAVYCFFAVVFTELPMLCRWRLPWAQLQIQTVSCHKFNVTSEHVLQVISCLSDRLP